MSLGLRRGEVNARVDRPFGFRSAPDVAVTMGFLAPISLEMLAISWLGAGSLPISAPVQEDPAEVERSFLAQEAAAGEFLALASFPELLERRPVQMKVFRSLRSRDSEIFRAAVRLCLEAPRLESFAMIRRRLTLAFRSRESGKRKAILELARDEPRRWQDLRFVSLLSEALGDPDPALAGLALSLVEDRPGLRELPAVVESLARVPGAGRSADPELPSFQFFRDRILPLLTRAGADDKSCFDCHRSHVVFRLEPPSGGPSEDEEKTYYRSALRVVDPKRPEQSLLLLKPTREKPPEGTRASGPDRHGGGVRWSPGSASYRTILEWVRTAGN